MDVTNAFRQVEAEIKRRASSPEACLLAIFDVFDGRFHKKSFEGCSFTNVLLESKADSPVRREATNTGVAYVDEGIDCIGG